LEQAIERGAEVAVSVEGVRLHLKAANVRRSGRVIQCECSRAALDGIAGQQLRPRSTVVDARGPVFESDDLVVRKQLRRAHRFEPIVLGDESALPDLDYLNLDYFRDEQRDARQAGITPKGLTASWLLAQNYAKGIRTVPTSKARAPAAVKAQARLAQANTASKLDDLLRNTLANIMDVGAIGTDANYTSFWLRYRHFCLESGRAPLRWALLDNPSDDTIRAEGELFGRAVLWAANYYGD
jgi:hypothetical protein